MKELYEKNKKLFCGAAAGVCVLLCVVIAVIAGVAGKGNETTDKGSKETVQASKDVSDMEEVMDDELEDVSMEAVSTEALEIVEDSPLDIVEPTQPAVSPEPSATPDPSATPGASATPGPSATPTATPGPNVSNMAQNVPFPYEIHVNKQMNCITVYAMDVNGSYSIPLKAMVCSTGAATPLGVYRTPAKYIWKVLKGNVWGQYSTRISGAILFHSVPYSTNSKSALISKYYNKLGTTASAGCVRLTTADAKWIYDNCPLGTTVIIYNDSNPGPLGKPSAMKVPAGNKWDPTDPDPANPWRNKVLRIDGVQNRVMERGSNINLMDGITAYDTAGNNVTANVQVTHNADTNTAGVYGVHYTIADSLGNSLTADATLTVVDTQGPVMHGIQGRITGKRASEITRDFLLAGVTATDNGQPLSLAYVSVQIPTLQDGDNVITYIARDMSGNQTTMTGIVNCDLKAPVITKNANAASVLELNELPQFTSNYCLGRISVQDASSYTTKFNWTEDDWGYSIEYTATDAYGNVSNYTDRLKYLEYSFVGDMIIRVNDINNTAELKSGLSLRDSKGRTISIPENVSVDTRYVNAGTYKAVYTYTYSSPAGNRTATFERIVMAGE